MSKERRREIAVKGGKTMTEKRRQSAKLAGIKTRIKNGNFKDVDAEWILKKLEDPEAMDLDILLFADSIKNKLHPMQKVAFLNALTQAKKAIHGDKVQQTNVNVNMDIEEWERRMMSDD